MRRWLWILLVALTLCSACGKRKILLSEHKMEDVLFDYHLSMSMMRLEGADSIRSKQYLQAILTKHNITQEQFDSSMVYYMTHADRMRDIYEHLSSRFTNEGRLQGLEGSNLSTTTTFEGDTANLWNLPPVEVFTEYVPNSLLKFTIPTDSTFLEGDKFTFSFDTQFLSQDNLRNGFCAFTVHFTNDSVVTRWRQLTSNNFLTLEVDDNRRVGVKKLSGYVLLRPSKSTRAEENTAPLRLMVISGIRLIRMHTDPPEDFVKPTIKNDSNETIKPTLPPDTLLHES